MLGQRFKLIFLYGGSSRKREFNFTKKQFLLCAGAFALAFLLLSLMTGSTLYSWYSASRLSALTYKNSMLKKQLAGAAEQIEELGSKIDQLSQHGSELRAYANLPLLDPEAQQMGIGGSLPYRNSMNFGAEELLAKIEQLDRQISLQENSLVDRKIICAAFLPSGRLMVEPSPLSSAEGAIRLQGAGNRTWAWIFAHPPVRQFTRRRTEK